MFSQAPQTEPCRYRRPAARLPFTRAVLLGVLLGLTGCGGDGSEGDPGSGPGDGDAEILVSAASSLSEAFAQLAAEFERQHPGITVRLNLAGSSSLRAQIMEGAPVDVFASANEAIMSELIHAGLAPPAPVVFARNSLVIAVPSGNPAGITGLEDFARTDLLLGLCAPVVPCGELAHRALTRASVRAAIDSGEPDVRALLTKIRLGELDGGIVYRTDVSGAEGQVEAIPIPEAFNQTTGYPIAVLTGAPHPAAARRFVDFVLSPAGREILTRQGFVQP